MKHHTGSLHVILTIVFGAVVIAALAWVFWQNFLEPKAGPETTTTQQTDAPAETPPVQEMKTAGDTTLGSGFTLTYPADWKMSHAGAKNPKAKIDPQSDTTTLTSPSGKIKVVLDVLTNAQLGGYCQNDSLKLKYLSTDTLPDFSDGRFAAYVVTFGGTTTQYHVGLQKNTKEIRAVTLKSNTTCAFFFSEYVPRESSIDGVPKTVTTLDILFPELGNEFGTLKSGLDETDVKAKLTGEEYAQAKAIVQSLRVE